MKSELAMLIAALPALSIFTGLVIGAIRYRKYGAEIKERVTKEYAEKRARGGIHSLYHKRPDRRIAYETFGLPLFVSMGVAIVIVFVIFLIF